MGERNTSFTVSGIAYDRAGPRADGATVVLLHAGVGGRRMWDPDWAGLARHHDVIRCDLRGFGESTGPPTEAWVDVDEDELDPSPLDRLSEIEMPVFLLVGGLDLDAILAIASRLATQLPRVRVVEWSDSAHMVTLEHPDEFLQIVTGWLTEQGHD